MRIGPAPSDPKINHCIKTGPSSCKLDYPVIRQPLFVVQFDRPLSPSSVFRGNFSIESGTSKDLFSKLVRVDPVERAVVFTIDKPLLPSVAYELVIHATDPNPLAAYDGARFEGTYTIEFTSQAASTESETDLDPGPLDPCAAFNVLQGSCLGSSCHGSKGATAPALGLSFASNAAVQATAVGKSSILVQGSAAPRVGAPNAPFPYGLQIISPGDSASSFLLYKILMDSAARSGTLDSDGSLALGTIAQTPQTPQRMSAVGVDLSRTIPGSPMPHPTLLPDPDAGPAVNPYDPLSLDNLRLLRRWIDRGAPACSPDSGDAGVDSGLDGGTDAATDGALDASDGASLDAADGG